MMDGGLGPVQPDPGSTQRANLDGLAQSARRGSRTSGLGVRAFVLGVGGLLVVMLLWAWLAG